LFEAGRVGEGAFCGRLVCLLIFGRGGRSVWLGFLMFEGVVGS